MRPYSLDLRERIVQAVAAGATQAAVAEVFSVGRATVQRYVAHRRRRGSLAPRPFPGRAARLGPTQAAGLRAAGARTHEALHAAIATVLGQITAADARGFFQHCGYRLAQRH